MDIPSSAPTAWTGNPKLKHSKSYSGGSSNVLPPMSYNTYAVPRGVNGTPPTSRAIPPAVPPRNRNMSEGRGGSQLTRQLPQRQGRAVSNEVKVRFRCVIIIVIVRLLFKEFCRHH